MAATIQSVRALLGELRRRSVVRVAGFYVVAAWALLQAADVLGPDLGFPDGTVGVLFWVALAGFVLTILLAIAASGGLLAALVGVVLVAMRTLRALFSKKDDAPGGSSSNDDK